MKSFMRYVMLFVPFLLFNFTVKAEQSNLSDSGLYTKASAVVRAQVLERGGGSKYLRTKVKVLEVVKKSKEIGLSTELWLYHYSFGNNIPDGISTLYLVPYNEIDLGFAWKLLEECRQGEGGMRCSNGFSHNSL